jgi:hypothetical protein
MARSDKPTVPAVAHGIVARCPICGDVLLPTVTYFVEGVAFCKTCEDVFADDVIRGTVAMTKHACMSKHCHTAHGLIWWTPAREVPKMIQRVWDEQAPLLQ